MDYFSASTVHCCAGLTGCGSGSRTG